MVLRGAPQVAQSCNYTVQLDIPDVLTRDVDQKRILFENWIPFN